MFKLCPRYLCSYDQDAFNSLGNPTAVASYTKSASEAPPLASSVTTCSCSFPLAPPPTCISKRTTSYIFYPFFCLRCFSAYLYPRHHFILTFLIPGEFVQRGNVVNPLYDYVTPDLVTLFISNMYVKAWR